MANVGLQSRQGLSIARFSASMPAPYTNVFTETEIAEHLRIVLARSQKAAHAEIWRTFRGGGTALCVVADDRPGLLSLIMMAFDDHALDVTSAQIFCRDREDGVVEAVDFFWVRSLERSRALTSEEVERVGETLVRLIRRDEPVSRPAAHSATIPVGPAGDNQVYVDPDALARGDSVLVVEAQDYPGLLFAITSELHRCGVEIVSSSATTEGTLARDRFLLRDEQGRSLRGERLAAVRLAVLGAISGRR